MAHSRCLRVIRVLFMGDLSDDDVAADEGAEGARRPFRFPRTEKNPEGGYFANPSIIFIFCIFFIMWARFSARRWRTMAVSLPRSS